MVGGVRKNLMNGHFLYLQVLGNEVFLCIKETLSKKWDNLRIRKNGHLWVLAFKMRNSLKNSTEMGDGGLVCGHKFCRRFLR